MFEVFNESGELILSDKSYSIIGQEVVLNRGQVAIENPDDFIGVAVYPSELANGAIVTTGAAPRSNISTRVNKWGGSNYIKLTGQDTIRAVVFRKDNQSVGGGSFGIEIRDADGLLTFSSSDYHFKLKGIRSATPRPVGFGGQPGTRGLADGLTEPIEPEALYMVTCSSLALTPIWIQSPDDIATGFSEIGISRSGGNFSLGFVMLHGYSWIPIGTFNWPVIPVATLIKLKGRPLP